MELELVERARGAEASEPQVVDPTVELELVERARIAERLSYPWQIQRWSLNAPWTQVMPRLGCSPGSIQCPQPDRCGAWVKESWAPGGGPAELVEPVVWG